MITDPFTSLDENQLHDSASTFTLSVPWLTQRPFRILTGSSGRWGKDGFGLSPGAAPLFYKLAGMLDAGEPRMATQNDHSRTSAESAAELARALTCPGERNDVEQRCDLLLSPETVGRWELESGRVARFMEDSHQHQVVFGSPTLDIATTSELAAEMVELGEVLLRLTHLQVRLLSRSPEVAYTVARGLHHRLPGASKSRVIFGLAVGGFEREAAPPARYSPNAIEQVGALNWLQDHGFRSFCVLGSVRSGRLGDMRGMLRSLRADRCEDVWTCSE
jgi:hypothetical protein